MDKKIYVSDVLDIDKIVRQHGNKIMLIAGVGSGKSTWVKDVLAKKGTVLFVTSRKAKVEEDINSSCFSDIVKWNTVGNQTLITNAKLAKIVEYISQDNIRELDDFMGLYDYIVVDEIHSIATDSSFADSCPGILSFIEYAAVRGKIVIIMTGTPEPVKDYFVKNKWCVLDYRKICNYVHPRKIVLTTKRSVDNIIEKNWSERTIIYFANSTNNMVSLCEKLVSDFGRSPGEIALVVAKSKEKEFEDKLSKSKLGKSCINELNKSSKCTYENIIMSSFIPDKCKILISTSTLREGVDIKNESVVMICENHILSNLIQFFGRARSSNCDVYVIENVSQHDVYNNELLYDYANKEEVAALNRYLNSQVHVESNIFSIIEKHDLIKYSKKNPYIYFDYIDNQFKVYDLKSNEEKRLLGIYNWKKDILSHCQEYDIPFIGFIDLPGLMREILQKMHIDGREISVKSKDMIISMLTWAYGIDAKQPQKINVELEKQNVDYRIISRKWNSGENRNQQYWKLVAACEIA